jgi:hypothetical protein
MGRLAGPATPAHPHPGQCLPGPAMLPLPGPALGLSGWAAGRSAGSRSVSLEAVALADRYDRSGTSRPQRQALAHPWSPFDEQSARSVWSTRTQLALGRSIEIDVNCGQLVVHTKTDWIGSDRIARRRR